MLQKDRETYNKGADEIYHDCAGKVDIFLNELIA